MKPARGATLRLAWRLIRRAPARSALIATLVAVPVAAGAFAVVTIRTAQLSADEAADRTLGRADAIAVVTTVTSLEPATAVVGRAAAQGGTRYVYDDTARAHSQPQTDIRWVAQLPAGSRIVPNKWIRPLRVSTGGLSAQVEAVALDLGDPVTEGIYDVRRGRASVSATGVAVTEALAERLGVDVGDRLQPTGLPVLTVRAVVRDPGSRSSEQLVGSAAAFGGLDTFTDLGANLGGWLIDTPGPAPDLHAALAAEGVVYATRNAWQHPPAGFMLARSVDTQVLLVLATVAGFALLEVVLLAGAAFAVGARRQSRELGLLAATGGDADDVRRVVVGQGVLLGTVGSMAGIVVGVVAVALARDRLESIADRTFGGLDPRAGDLLAVALIGLVAGFVAALAPARGTARRSVLDMLANRFLGDDDVAPNPRWANVALVAGPVLAVVGALAWHATTGTVSRSLVEVESLGDLPPALARAVRDDGWAAVIWLGAAVTLAGLVRSCPTLLGRLGRTATLLPLSPRLALRDAARHRHRTAPAVAAVMTVLAGAVLVLFVVSSADVKERRSYTPVVPVGTLNITTSGDPSVSADEAARLVATATGGGFAMTVPAAQRARSRSALLAAIGHCAADSVTPTCTTDHVGVVDQAALDVLTGGPVLEARRALASGAAVVLGSRFGTKPPVVVAAGNDHVRLAGVGLGADSPSYAGVPSALISAQTAAAHGWQVGQAQGGVIFVPRHVPDEAAVDALRDRLGDNVGVYVERGYEGHYSIVLIAMLAGAGLATLAGTSVAVALAMAESRADMATLAAVGASPRRRRLHAMAQAATVGALGAVLGLGLGTLIALATLGGARFYPTSTPYRWLALVVLTAPALGVLVAGVFTRSKVTMTRRLT
jgi:putative ABC transport system permease protein